MNIEQRHIEQAVEAAGAEITFAQEDFDLPADFTAAVKATDKNKAARERKLDAELDAGRVALAAAVKPVKVAKKEKKATPEAKRAAARAEQVREKAAAKGKATGATLKLSPKDGEKSGAFIQRVLRGNRFKGTHAELAVIVHGFYPAQKTTAKDVAWNKWKIKQDDAAAA